MFPQKLAQFIDWMNKNPGMDTQPMLYWDFVSVMKFLLWYGDEFAPDKPFTKFYDRLHNCNWTGCVSYYIIHKELDDEKRLVQDEFMKWMIIKYVDQHNWYKKLEEKKISEEDAKELLNKKTKRRKEKSIKKEDNKKNLKEAILNLIDKYF